MEDTMVTNETDVLTYLLRLQSLARERFPFPHSGKFVGIYITATGVATVFKDQDGEPSVSRPVVEGEEIKELFYTNTG